MDIKYYTGSGDLTDSILVIDEQPIFARGLAVAVDPGIATLIRTEPGNAHKMLAAMDVHRYDLVFVGCCNLEDLSSVRSAVWQLEKKNIPVLVTIDEFKYPLMSPHIPSAATLILRNSTLGTICREAAKVLRSRNNLQKSLRRPVMPSPDPASLSPAEKSVLREILKGYSLTEIASRLRKSVKTVSSQKYSAMKRLGIKNTKELYLTLMTPNLSSLLNNQK